MAYCIPTSVRSNMENSEIVQRRLDVVNGHLSTKQNDTNIKNPDENASFNPTSKKITNDTTRSIPRIRQQLLKWNGWGYRDSQFFVQKDENGLSLAFTGDRYKLGNVKLPYAVDHLTSILHVCFEKRMQAQPPPSPSDYPKPIINEGFLNAVKGLKMLHSLEGEDRLFRAHGHTVSEIFTLREGSFPRIPDLVIWPSCHEMVERVVEAAVKCDVVLIPIGGGTSVTGALLCPEDEKRMIVSLDTTEMCHILWIDTKNLTARVEAGMIGQDLEKQMFAKGFTVGHEPDSFEFSSVGGWVATRASGMKKNVYGNIEDLVVQIRAVTPQGTVHKFPAGPRISAGPDVHHFLLGSEGTLGVITEVTLKIRPLPPVKRYGSLAFPDLDAGIKCLREVAYQRCQPASIRLMDNEQFQLSHAFKYSSGFFAHISDGIKKTYLTWFKGFQLDKMTVATLVFEGSESDVTEQERKVYEIAQKFGGLAGGSKNGEIGYMLTFVIAYIRDLGLDYGVIAESFETSCPWDKVFSLCHNVKHRIKKECKDRGIDKLLISCRVTQTYDAGACIYFYFAFNYIGVAGDTVHLYEEIESCAREEVIGCGGNISHHHGVGKIRKKFMAQTLSSPAIGSLQALKHYFDPTNVFANNNIV